MDVKDLYWAAGFIDGGGHSDFSSGSPKIAATQKSRELLDRLVLLFGGNVRYCPEKIYESGKTRKAVHVWELMSNYAIGVMMTLYPLMSQKRQNEYKEIIHIWKSWRNSANNSKFRTHCFNGHVLTADNIYIPNSGQKLCIQCRIAARKRWSVNRRIAKLDHSKAKQYGWQYFDVGDIKFFPYEKQRPLDLRIQELSRLARKACRKFSVDFEFSISPTSIYGITGYTIKRVL